MGIAPHIVEKLLNHSLPGVMGVYNRETYDAERQQALEAWSAKLLGFVDQPAGENVVSINSKAPQAA
jgi:hypothetical protein